jgi:hypothetical protein
MLAEVSIVSKSASVGWELLNDDDSLASCDISGIITCSWKEADTDSAKGKMNARRCGKRMVMRIGPSLGWSCGQTRIPGSCRVHGHVM